jgi:hypothetical protein
MIKRGEIRSQRYSSFSLNFLLGTHSRAITKKNRTNTFRLLVTYLYYQHIIEQFRDARSIFRLSKSIFEVKRIQLIKERTSDRFARLVNILSRLFYLFFWLFDNIQILFKLLKPNNLTQRDFVQTLSRRFHLIG